ncbi:MAG: hypothetical protein U5K54_29655 [Cytophagales bacterium]|nr:hypothetical protein [Cytophagales bacterium]
MGEEIPQQLFLRQPFNGQWKTWTYQQAGDEIRRVAAGIQFAKLSTRK